MMDTEIMAGAVIAALKKGDRLKVGNIEYWVKSRSEKNMRISSAAGTGLITLGAFNNYPPLSKKARQFILNFFRNIEVDINFDLAHENNQFHTVSDSFRIAIKYIKKAKNDD